MDYGLGTDIEWIISAIKRLFGEHLRSHKWENMVRDQTNVATYNRWLKSGRAAA